jgi:hypothetical protein
VERDNLEMAVHGRREHGMNIAQRILSLTAIQGVSAWRVGEARTIGGDQHVVTLAWTYGTTDVRKRGGGDLIVSGYETPQESAAWAGELPELLRPAVAAPGYITERNTPFTHAQVVDFANAQWRAQGAAYASAPDILGIELDNLDGKSVKVSGLFWMEGGGRSNRAYVIRLVDPNGNPSGANVKLELIS